MALFERFRPGHSRQSDLYATETFAGEPVVPENTVRSMIERMVQLNLIDAKAAQATPVSAYFDNTFVAELKQSGFLDNPWK